MVLVSVETRDDPRKTHKSKTVILDHTLLLTQTRGLERDLRVVATPSSPPPPHPNGLFCFCRTGARATSI